MSEQEEIRALFLREFTKMLVISFMPSLFETFEKTLAKQTQVKEVQKPDELSVQPEELREKVEGKTADFASMQASPKQVIMPAQQIQRISQGVQQKPRTVPVQRIQSKPQIASAQQFVAADGMGMSIIAPLINDPSVMAIECVEVGKPLMITRRGMKQPTNIVLTNDEVKSIMDEFSEKTKIPLLPGIFKVAYMNLIVTAIISEYIGTKFIIQKKIPAAPAPYRQPYRL